MDIVEILEKELKILKEIDNVLEIEKDCLMKEDGEKLLEIIKIKKEKMNQLQDIEEKRNKIDPNMTLKELEDKGILLGNELKDLVRRIGEQQETNQLLTQQSLSYAQRMLSLFKGQKETSLYGANGKVGNPPKGYARINHSV